VKAQLLSDLHSEFYPDPVRFLKTIPFEPNLDFLLLPGDLVVPCRQSPQAIKDVLGFLSSKARHAVFVAGNHEYYGGSKEEAEAVLSEAMPPNFHWLRNGDETVEGVRFFGGTLWFPLDKENWYHRHKLNDFSQIRGFADWVYTENGAFREAAWGLVRGGTVVLSHHVPSILAIHPRYRDDRENLNRFFVSDLTSLILEKQPRLWVYGHTHLPYDRTMGGTRVVANPFGYPHENRLSAYPPVVADVPGSPSGGICSL